MLGKHPLSEINRTALPFVVGLSIYSALGASLFYTYGKTETHLILNAVHFGLTDTFFKYVTHIGDGVLPVIVSLFLLFVRFSWALSIGIAASLMGITVQLLKRSVFNADHRPAMFFPDGGLPNVDGVELMLHNSFPSGHSATAFCLCFLLACFTRHRWLRITLVITAFLASFSRVYISQHFIQDTIVGAWIGLLIAYAVQWVILNYLHRNPASKLNGRLWPS